MTNHTTATPADYYVYERGTTTGGTRYEPMHRNADPDDATTGPSFDTREEAQAWIDQGRVLVTATYTDPTTGWVQRVQCHGEAPADHGTADTWVWVRNAEDQVAKVPDTTLSDFRRQQGANREYLPATPADDDLVDPAEYIADCATAHIISTGEGNYSQAVRDVAPGAARHATSPRVRALAERLVAHPHSADVANIAADVKRRFTPFIHPIT